MKVPRWIVVLLSFGAVYWALRTGWWILPQLPVLAGLVLGSGIVPMGFAVARDLGDRKPRRLDWQRGWRKT